MVEWPHHNCSCWNAYNFIRTTVKEGIRLSFGGSHLRAFRTVVVTVVDTLLLIELLPWSKSVAPAACCATDFAQRAVERACCPQLEGEGMKNWFLRACSLAFVASLAFALAGCGIAEGVLGQGSSPEAPAENSADQESAPEDNPLTIEAVYCVGTGTYEPSELAGDYDEVKANMLAGEAERGKKSLFVIASIKADERENKRVAIGQNVGGTIISGVKLNIDGINEYGDNWALNADMRDYSAQLEDLGYGDGIDNKELLGGSGDVYKAVLWFDVNNADIEQGQTAHLNWDDYNAEFNIADIRFVDTPLDMVNELAS